MLTGKKSRFLIILLLVVCTVPTLLLASEEQVIKPKSVQLNQTQSQNTILNEILPLTLDISPMSLLKYQNKLPLMSVNEVNTWATNYLNKQLHLSDKDALFVSRKVRDIGGFKVYSIVQKHAGIPVIARNSKLLISANGKRLTYFGFHQPTKIISAQSPSISRQQATAIARINNKDRHSLRLIFWPSKDKLILAYEITGSTIASVEKDSS